MASVYISDKSVVKVVPYAARHVALRLDVGPFAVLYMAVYWCIWELGVKDGRGKAVVLVALPVLLVSHLLVFLSTHWSVRFMCLVSQKRVASIDSAESVRVVPAKHCGSMELVLLHRRRVGIGGSDNDQSKRKKATPKTGPKREEEGEGAPLVSPRATPLKVAGEVFPLPDVWFVFRQTKYVLREADDDNKLGFVRLEYPSEGSFKAYLGCRGLKDEAALAGAAERWGPNVLDIPLPSFMKLFAEHAVAPFFVFQMLCVAMWSLDDYWYYALFTLAMLVLFEAMLCVQRQKNLEMLRSMRREPTVIYALRFGRWQRVSSEAVTPGEVVSLVARPPTVASAMKEAQRRAQRQHQRMRVAGGVGGGNLKNQPFGFPMGMRGGAERGGGMGMDIMSGGGGEMDSPGVGDGEALAPFDLLLMRGSCVVNEAMLTGESVPQSKTSLSAAGGGGGGDDEAWLKIEEDGTDSPHRKHVIFSGTKVLQHTDNIEGAAGFASDIGGGGGDKFLSEGWGRGGKGGVGIEWPGLPLPPDKGCPCVVLRTGFETSQGQLMKTILFSTKRVAAGSDWETGLFIFILLVFAAVASAFVLTEGLADETRNSFKLMLHCIMILTSVIPPELPIELSLAVMNSLTALTQSLIFCTEPFRIPYAGKVDVCCFDKTGTLTSDNLVMKGVAGASYSNNGHNGTVQKTGGVVVGGGRSGGGGVPAATAVVSADELGEIPTRILAGCHSLVTLQGALVGDSVEVATLKGLGWACLRGGLVIPRAAARAARAENKEKRNSVEAGGGGGSGGGGKEAKETAAEAAAKKNTPATPAGPDRALQALQVVHCWSFDPSLRRMCTAVRLASEVAGLSVFPAVTPPGSDDTGDSKKSARLGTVPPFHDRLWVVAKGAPESLEPLLTDAPPNYRSTFLHHMGQGSRVLALAYRALDPKVDLAGCRSMSRAAAEKGLRFGGFLVLGCPIKLDAPYVVRELRESSHAVAMITGDGALTAADVARQVGMIDQPPSRTLVLSVLVGGEGGGVATTSPTSTLTTEKEKFAGGITNSAITATAGDGKKQRKDGNGSGRSNKNEGTREYDDHRVAHERGSEEGLLSLAWVSIAADFSGASGEGEGEGKGIKSGGQQVDGSELDSNDGAGSIIPFHPKSLPSLAKRYALCVTGDVLSQVALISPDFHTTPSDEVNVVGASAKATVTAAGVNGGGGNGKALSRRRHQRTAPSSALSALCSHATVFARVSPAQKELIVGELNAAGRTTVMCGDGTNDVGALRRAHVGISIVNSPELEKRLESFLEVSGENSSGSGGVRGERGDRKRGKSQRATEARQSRMLASREKQEQELDPALVKLGDASIASPFTAKTTSVGCVLAVIRQGRCTLVTTLQVYKILALNCLTSAYMLSALYLKGLKQGDGQMTVLGLVISALFYFASRSQPLRRLSAARPPARIFCAQACLSVLGQFVVHLVALLAVTWLCEGHVNPEDPSVLPDGPFRPNTFNSAVFLLSAFMQVNTFAANYTGHPFMQSLRENRPMWYLVLGSYASLLLASSGLVPFFEYWLQLSPFPEGLRGPLVLVLATDTFLVFLVDITTGWFANRRFGGKGAAQVVVDGGGKRKGKKRSSKR